MIPTGEISTRRPLALTKAFVPLPNFNGNQYAFQPFDGRINQYLRTLRSDIGQKDTLSFYAFCSERSDGNTLPSPAQLCLAWVISRCPSPKQFVTSWNHTSAATS